MTDTTFTYSNSTTQTVSLTTITSTSYTIPSGFNLTGVQVGTTVTSIGASAFQSKSTLTSVTFNIPSTLTSILGSAFQDCTGFTSLTLPPSLTSFPNSFAFRGCTGLTSLSLPSNLVSFVGSYTFQLCSGLTSLTFPVTLTNLGQNTFTSCANITSVTFPSNLKTIGPGCFQSCSKLSNVNFPTSLTDIGVAAFNGCTGITSLTLPSSLTNIGVSAFQGCSNITGSIIIPSGITNVPQSCFQSCSKVTSLDLPSLLSIIGTNAFNGCSLLSAVLFRDQSKLTSAGTTIFTGLPSNAVVTYYFTPSYNNLSALSKSLQSQFPVTTTYVYNPSCFNSGTKILCLNKNFQEEYIKIENLRKGDLVKTHLHGYRKIEFIGKGFGKNMNERIVGNMYKLKNTPFEELLEVSGGHSILIDDLGEYREENTKLLGGEQKIDNKYLLLAVVSKDFESMEQGYEFTYYHFTLECDYDEQRFGVWANNVLTETTSKKHFLSFHFLPLD